MEILYFADGQADIITHGQAFHVSLYDMVVYPGDTPHQIFWQLEQHRHFYSLGLYAPAFAPPCTLHLKDHDGTMKWLMEHIHQEYNAKPRDEVLVDAYVRALLLLVNRSRADDPKPHDPMDRVLQYIDAHYAEPLTLQSLARLLPVSRSYLSRAFRRRTGVTVMEHLHAVRIEAAKRLLRQTDLPVEAISGNVGFLSSKHFSRVFREATGLSPRAFRNT